MKAMGNQNKKIFITLVAAFILLLAIPFTHGYTNEEDVYAINSLYVSLGSPTLPGWTASGGDPCLEAWQGVQCIGSNITSIILNGANLGGELGDKLNNFTSIITIDLSNNNIGGAIPENLPISMSKFFLSANMFTGSIPSSLSELTLLSDMSANENHLTGELPDAFQNLVGLINFDLSSNNITGPLPPSMANLSSLTTLHVQNNSLTGTLDVLQDLPLKNLNIEYNQFSAPIPQKLQNIPIFLKDGNPFNTYIAPSPALAPPERAPSTLAPPSLPFSETPVPGKPSTSSSGSSSTAGGKTYTSSSVPPASSSDRKSTSNSGPTGGKKKSYTLKVIGVVVVAVIVFIVVLLAVLFCVSKYQKRSEYETFNTREERVHHRPKEPRIYQDTAPKRDDILKFQEAVKEPKSKENFNNLPNPPEKALKGKLVNHEENEGMNRGNILVTPPLPEKAKPRVFNVDNQRATVNARTAGEKVTAGPKVSNQGISKARTDVGPPPSVVSFSVASLQQYTEGFREENLILDGRMGKVYLANHPQMKKMLAVLKLDATNSSIPDDKFLELVLSVSELRHPKVAQLRGYCMEYGQRLLVYEYFSSRTLHDVLHCGDDLRRRLSWNARIKVALEAAQALEYLHEKCQPPVIHKNFDPSSVLIDDNLAVCVSDCGLASLTQSHSAAQLSGRIRALFSYEAPEVGQGGTHSEQSDVYSFGVVMLEILTGRIPYDSARPRAEQHLTRWASSQLHDINALSWMVDPSIEGKYPVKSLSRFADVISGCIQRGPEFRPPMSQVAQDLARILDESRSRGNGAPP